MKLNHLGKILFWSLFIPTLFFLNRWREKKIIYRPQPSGASVMVIILFTATEKQLCNIRAFVMLVVSFYSLF